MVVVTPHNVHLEGHLGVIEAGWLEGILEGSAVRLRARTDLLLAAAVKAALRTAGLPLLGVSFGGNSAAEAVMPLDWAVLIPLWFLGGRLEPAVETVVVTPARELDAAAHQAAGRALAGALESSPRRVGLVASADHGHGHLESGPYGFREASGPYDRRVVELIEGNRLAELASFERDWVEAAAADSWWQLLMLEGALAATGEWRPQLLSYEAPTYFGMLTAAFQRPARK